MYSYKAHSVYSWQKNETLQTFVKGLLTDWFKFGFIHKKSPAHIDLQDSKM